jgi:hypothetical protein
MARRDCRRLGGGSGDAFHDTGLRATGRGYRPELGLSPRPGRGRGGARRERGRQRGERRSAARRRRRYERGSWRPGRLCGRRGRSRAAQSAAPADTAVALGGRDGSALGTGAEAVQRNFFTEDVFYWRSGRARGAAASVLGITRIVPARGTCWRGWRGGTLLARGVPAAGGVRARRGGAPAAGAGCSDGRSVAAPASDGRDGHFASYIRFLLGIESGSRQRRPRAPASPYRTMCGDPASSARTAALPDSRFPVLASSPSASSPPRAGEKETRAGAG